MARRAKVHRFSPVARHHVPEDELRDKVQTIQARTKAQIERAANAMTDMLDAILEAKAAGAEPEQLAPIYDLQRKAMWRLDFISSEKLGRIPRGPGSRSDPGRVDRLQPPGTGSRLTTAVAGRSAGRACHKTGRGRDRRQYWR
jgi:hypothetical protein